MHIQKVLNSSVVLVQDDSGEESILLGKGIGYGRKAGEPIERQPSDRVFLPLSNPDAQPMLELFSSIPASYLELTQDIVDDAEQSLGVKLSAHIYQPRDKGLNGNEKIEQAVAALQQEPTQEQLAHTLTVIRRRIKEHGQLVVAVEPNLGSEQMQLRAIRTADGASWWYAFTSFDEEMKGAEPVQSTFLVDMDKLFDAALAVPEISGIILNPWNRTIQLDKTLIRIIKGA